MAEIHVRGVSDELVRQVNIKAAKEGKTQKAIILEALQLIISSNPVKP